MKRGGVLALALALAGMLMTFGAGWLVSGHRSQNRADAVLAGRTVAAEQSQEQQTQLPAPSVAPYETTYPLPAGSVGLDDSSSGAAAGSGQLPKTSRATRAPIGTFDCPAPTVRVSTADELTKALDAARPGTVIQLADGSYRDRFEATHSGTARKPIYLCGSRSAVLDGGGIKGGYGLHLDGASYWRIDGFTVQNAQKGVVLDDVSQVAVQDLLVQQIGDEGVHLRRGSTSNVVRGLTIQQTGERKPKFGEGVYIGSAQSNWCSVNNCQPDHSDDNFVLGNRISQTGAEAVDIKEGTSGGVLVGNRFDGTGMSGADSWVDVKGNGWLIDDNTGAHAPQDGFQVHEILNGWGMRNLFSGNTSTVDAGGYGIHVTKTRDQNVVTCDNQATGAAQGMTNIPCS